MFKSDEVEGFWADYVASMWKGSCNIVAHNLLPENCSWERNEEKGYQIVWFEGDAAPMTLDDILVTDEPHECIDVVEDTQGNGDDDEGSTVQISHECIEDDDSSDDSDDTDDETDDSDSSWDED